MYSVDALCRRSEPLQQTVHAQSLFVGLCPADAANLGLANGDAASVEQESAAVELPVRVSREVPEGAAWVRSGTCATRTLGDAIGPVKVSKAGGQG